jgi:hypothetical protein
MSESSRKIEHDIQESLDMLQAEEDLRSATNADIAKAVETAAPSPEKTEALHKLEFASEYASKIQQAFEKKDQQAIASLTGEFRAAGGDASVLSEQLKAVHDSYFELGLKEKASEIDAYRRKLLETGDVRTDAGKDFLDRLARGEFSSEEDAIYALAGIKDQAKGESAEALNAEFLALQAKINEKFPRTDKGSEEKIDFGTDDIDSALGNLG